MSTQENPAPRLALTGGTGFVGSHLIEAALTAGYEINALTRRPQPPRPGLTWIDGDLEHSGALRELVSGADAVIHAAGLVKALRRRDFQQVNIAGSRALAEAVSEAAGGDTHFIQLSSLAARQPHLSDYAGSKRHGEGVIRDALGDNHPWTVLRPPAVYGPGDVEILKLLRLAGRGYLPMVAPRFARFSMIHVDDLARALIAVIGQSQCFGGTYELRDASADGTSMPEMAEMLGDIFGRKVRCIALPRPILNVAAVAAQLGGRIRGRPSMLSRQKLRELAHPDWLVSRNPLAEAGLWSPTLPLEAGMRETIDWYREKGLLK
ncbi:MAG: NAD-dependent epimerase/dehydratase family protein [Sphingomonadales bacterium]